MIQINTPEGWKSLERQENPPPPPEKLSMLSVRIRLEAAMKQLAPEIIQGKDCYLCKARIDTLNPNEILRVYLMSGDPYDKDDTDDEVDEVQLQSEPLAILSAMYDAAAGEVTVQVTKSDGTADTNEIIERFKEKVTAWVAENKTDTFRQKFGSKEKE